MLLLLLLLNLQKYQATQPYQSIRGKDLSANMISIQLRNAYKTGEKNPNTSVNAICLVMTRSFRVYLIGNPLSQLLAYIWLRKNCSYKKQSNLQANAVHVEKSNSDFRAGESHQKCQATERYQFTRGWGWSALTANYCCEVQYKLTMVCASVRAVSRTLLGKFGVD